jgi:hypothetical protein
VAKRHVDEVVSFKLRLPEGLRRQLEAEAQKSERSINSEILWRLGQTFGAEWRLFIAQAEDRERIKQEAVDRLWQDPNVQQSLKKIVEKLSQTKKEK